MSHRVRPAHWFVAMSLLMAVGIFLRPGDLFGQNAFEKIFFKADFNADPLGAVPAGSPSIGSAPEIVPFVGSVVWTGTSNLAKVEVVANPGGHGQSLLLSDALVPSGTGHAAVSFFAESAPSNVRFGHSFGLTLGDNFAETAFCSIIDNRTTPGTGRLSRIVITADRKLVVNGFKTGFKMQVGERYNFDLRIIASGLVGWLEVHVENTSGSQVLVVGPMPLLGQGKAVSEIRWSMSDTGNSSLRLDDVLIDQVW